MHTFLRIFHSDSKYEHNIEQILKYLNKNMFSWLLLIYVSQEKFLSDKQFGYQCLERRNGKFVFVSFFYKFWNKLNLPFCWCIQTVWNPAIFVHIMVMFVTQYSVDNSMIHCSFIYMRTTARLVKMNILSIIGPIRKGVRRK